MSGATSARVANEYYALMLRLLTGKAHAIKSLFSLCRDLQQNTCCVVITTHTRRSVYEESARGIEEVHNGDTIYSAASIMSDGSVPDDVADDDIFAPMVPSACYSTPVICKSAPRPPSAWFASRTVRAPVASAA